MGRCDQGIKFCSIFKVLGMRRKQCHCVRLVFLIPAVYLLSQTESVWRRYRDLSAKPNRQNFWMLTVPVRTVHTVTWQGRTIHTVTWQVGDVAHFHLLMLASSMMTRVRWMASNMRTRGPIHGRHVSPSFLFNWLCKIIWGVRGVRPPDLPQHQRLHNSPLAKVSAT
jgi:hypothetical protein